MDPLLKERAFQDLDFSRDGDYEVRYADFPGVVFGLIVYRDLFGDYAFRRVPESGQFVGGVQLGYDRLIEIAELVKQANDNKGVRK